MKANFVGRKAIAAGVAAMQWVIAHLKMGDCFIQYGTRHRWFNRGSVPAVVACAVIGGEPR